MFFFVNIILRDYLFPKLYLFIYLQKLAIINGIMFMMISNGI